MSRYLFIRESGKLPRALPTLDIFERLSLNDRHEVLALTFPVDLSLFEDIKHSPSLFFAHRQHGGPGKRTPARLLHSG